MHAGQVTVTCFLKAYSWVTSSELSTTHQQWPLLRDNQSTEGRHRVSSNGGRLNGNWPFSRHISRVPFDETNLSPGWIDRGERNERIDFADSFLSSFIHRMPQSLSRDSFVKIHEKGGGNKETKRIEGDNKIFLGLSSSKGWKSGKRLNQVSVITESSSHMHCSRMNLSP